MARVITGFGAGSMGVCMAYVSGATTLAERGKAMGVLAASGGLGFIFGPLFGLAFFKIQEGKKVAGATLDYATLPAYMAALFCILNIIILQCNFKEFRINEVSKSDKKKQAIASSRKLSINADEVVASLDDETDESVPPKHRYPTRGILWLNSSRRPCWEAPRPSCSDGWWCHTPAVLWGR